MLNKKHPYHLVNPSPWPLLASVSSFSLTIGGVAYMHSFLSGGFLFLSSFFLLVMVSAFWWRDVVREATFGGFHTLTVRQNLYCGMLLFIASEVMFFFGFFWAFFHASITPTADIGLMWPPLGIVALAPTGLPLANTLILLLSGAAVTWSHHYLVAGFRQDAEDGLFLTICLAFLFTALQLEEYIHAEFTMSDGVFGSTFFMATGFHGFHVIMGSLFLMVCMFRLKSGHFSSTHHIGFEAASWYWHFVDVVWLFLFLSMYWWGS